MHENEQRGKQILKRGGRGAFTCEQIHVLGWHQHPFLPLKPFGFRFLLFGFPGSLFPLDELGHAIGVVRAVRRPSTGPWLRSHVVAVVAFVAFGFGQVGWGRAGRSDDGSRCCLSSGYEVGRQRRAICIVVVVVVVSCLCPGMWCRYDRRGTHRRRSGHDGQAGRSAGQETLQVVELRDRRGFAFLPCSRPCRSRLPDAVESHATSHSRARSVSDELRPVACRVSIAHE
jgi:hypothetical protein